MIFKAGPTYDEIERKLEQWRPWFAWFPVRIGKRNKAWLQWIERRTPTDLECMSFIKPWYYRLNAESDVWCGDTNMSEIFNERKPKLRSYGEVATNRR